MPAPLPPTGAPVTLDAMLAARDQRAARQQDVLARFRLPVVSVTLVAPGPVKDTPRTRFALEAAAADLDALFRRQGWAVPFQDIRTAPTGPEALYAVAADALALKRALAEREDTHPLGRLWDLDVICPQRGGLSRTALGLAPRRCLVCGEPGHACARARRHPLDLLLGVIEERIDAYRA